jgi:hypothetical protein
MRIWKLIAHHDEPGKAFEAFCALGTVAIGWTDVGDLRQLQPTSASDISSAIQQVYPALNNAHLGGPSLWNFFRCVQVGDYVLVAGKGERRGVFEVLGDYTYATEDQAVLGYQHLRAATLTAIDPDGLWAACGRKAASGHLARWTMCLLQPTEQAEHRVFQEGRRYPVILDAAERNPKARAACLAHHGSTCKACGFSGMARFGEAGKDLIHVHHLKEMHTQSGVYFVDPIADLVPLCPNCHAMAHRRLPAYSVEELRAMLVRVEE